MYSCAAFGAVAGLARLRDAAVVIHGPESCAYLMESAVVSLAGEPDPRVVLPDNVFSTRMDADAAIFGGMGVLRGTMEEAYSRGFRTIGVVTTCVPGMIGDDCRAVVSGFGEGHPDCRVLLLQTDGVVAGDYACGLDMSTDAIVSMAERETVTDTSLINLVGASFVDIKCRAGERELGRMLGLFGIGVNCRFLDDASADDVRRFARAGTDMLMADTRNSRAVLDSVRRATDRRAPCVGAPVGIVEYERWVRRMGVITGRTDVAEAEAARARSDYETFVQEHRPRFEGRHVMIVAFISRNIDWLIEILEDMGASVVRVAGRLTPAEAGRQTAERHASRVVYGYDDASVLRDWEELRPDLLVYDGQPPAGYPGRTARLYRSGIGLYPTFDFVRHMEDMMRLPATDGWRSEA